MKLIPIIFGVTAVAGIVLGLWLALSSEPVPAKPVTEVTFPAPTTTPIVTTQPQLLAPKISSETNTDIARDLIPQMMRPLQITLRETVVESTYALQMWDTEHMGGQALLKYDSETGWRLISMGGGAWGVDSLADFGVPKEVAEKLIAGAQAYWPK